MHSPLSFIIVVCLFFGASRSAQIPGDLSLSARASEAITDTSAIFAAINQEEYEHTTAEKTDFEVNAAVHDYTPRGYHLVYGPSNAANVAPGYMGSSTFGNYDIAGCAHLCTTRKRDPKGGACKYFNIWVPYVKGVPKRTVCSMYYWVPDKSTAVNRGQGNLVVTNARGYALN